MLLIVHNSQGQTKNYKLYWNIVNLLKILILVVYFIFPQNKLGLHTFPSPLSLEQFLKNSEKKSSHSEKMRWERG